MDEMIGPLNTETGEEIQLCSATAGRGMAFMYLFFFIIMLFIGLFVLAIIPSYIDRDYPLLIKIFIFVAILFYLFLIVALYFNMAYIFRSAKKPY
jgi:hypothetical protein